VQGNLRIETDADRLATSAEARQPPETQRGITRLFLRHGTGRTMQPSNLTKFNDICAKIQLNIPPAFPWQWDATFQTVLVAIDCSEMDLVLFPITLEFDEQWDFATVQNLPSGFYRYFNDRFGIVPGQKIFTSQDADGRVLFAVWWPWGDGTTISLRIGLFVPDGGITAPDQIKSRLAEWFNI
jgi:hypothetical protein